MARKKSGSIACRATGQAFGILGAWKTMAVDARVWNKTVTEGGRGFMAAWRKE